MDGPACSPDIIFIENIGYILKNMVFNLHLKSIQKLKYSMQQT